MRKAIIAITTLIAGAAVIYMIRHNQGSYIKNQGFAHGTTYHIIYQHPQGINIKADLEKVMESVDRSLSTYDSTSVISGVNRNEQPELTDDFRRVFNKAMKVARKTDGAFDITVAPLVNAWGFGFTERTEVDSALVDSLLKFTGHEKVKLKNGGIIKQDPRLMLDVNAIAKGYSVDKTARFLEKQGVDNYMVEIGGEVRVSGKNNQGKAWRIGIDRPIDDPKAKNRQLKAVVKLSEGALATSGNYRRFYVKDGVKYSHTIHPQTGYPVRHSLLSASVYATDCMTADAYATAFMVMGLKESKEFVARHPALEAYFIYSGPEGDEKIYATEGFQQKLAE